MCPNDRDLSKGVGLQGVIGRDVEIFNVNDTNRKFQVFIFYPSDWDAASQSLLGAFSSFAKNISSNDCSLYGCSTDSVGSHLTMTADHFEDSLNFPLLSDISGKLAEKYSLFDQEEGINQRGVVITDNKGVALEVVNTSMEDADLVNYTIDLIQQTKSMRKRISERSCHFEKPCSNTGLDAKLEELADYSLNMVKRAEQIRSRSVSRTLARSVSRGRSLVRMTEFKQSVRDHSIAAKLRRTEDRLMRGYF